MSWARLDDGFPNNPKVAPLSDKAYRLHTTALCFCARNVTEGALSDRAVKVVMAEANSASKRHVDELHHAGLWDRTADGYLIHDWLDYNMTAEEVRAIKKARAEAGRKGGINSGKSRRGEANDEANASANGSKQTRKQTLKQGGSTPSHPLEEVKTISGEIERMRRKAEAKAQ